MIRDQSYGIIPVNLVDQTWHLLLVKQKGGHWSFPKGHPEPGESFEQTAFRELFEEAGIGSGPLLTQQTFSETYTFHSSKGLISKKVTYFLAQVKGEPRPDLDEVSECRWLPFSQAKQLLTFKEAQLIIDQVAPFLNLAIKP